jgi:hypothetical protein
VIARVFGLDPKTVLRYVGTARFRKFEAETDRAVASTFALRSVSLAARRVLAK